MKIHTLMLGLALVSLALTGCKPEAQNTNQPQPQPNVDRSGNPPQAATTPTTTTAYPLAKCVVSDEELGSMGDPVIVKIEGREVRLCCASCQDELKKNPQKYLTKLDNAAKSPAK